MIIFYYRNDLCVRFALCQTEELPVTSKLYADGQKTHTIRLSSTCQKLTKCSWKAFHWGHVLMEAHLFCTKDIQTCANQIKLALKANSGFLCHCESIPAITCPCLQAQDKLYCTYIYVLPKKSIQSDCPHWRHKNVDRRRLNGRHCQTCECNIQIFHGITL